MTKYTHAYCTAEQLLTFYVFIITYYCVQLIVYIIDVYKYNVLLLSSFTTCQTKSSRFLRSTQLYRIGIVCTWWKYDPTNSGEFSVVNICLWALAWQSRLYCRCSYTDLQYRTSAMFLNHLKARINDSLGHGTPHKHLVELISTQTWTILTLKKC